MRYPQRLTVAVILCVMAFLGGCQKRTDVNQNQNRYTNGQKYEMQVWTAGDEDFWKALSQEFKSQLNDSKIAVKVVNFDDEKTLRSYLVDALAEGGGPDVAVLGGDFVGGNAAKFIPLPEDDSLITVQNFEATFVKSASDVLIRDERIYGVPMGVTTLALLYNEDHLIDYLEDANTPSQTWDGFEDDVEVLTKPDNSFERYALSGAAMGRADNVHHGFDVIENMLMQLEGGLFSEDGQQATFASSYGISAEGVRQNLMQGIVEFYTEFAGDPAEEDEATWSPYLADAHTEYREFETFLRGKVSQIFVTPKDLISLIDLLETQGFQQGTVSPDMIKTALLPQFNDPDSVGRRRVVGHVTSLAVPRSAQYPTLAWAYLKFAIKKNVLATYFEESRLPSSRVDLLTEQGEDPLMEPFVRQAKFARGVVYPLNRETIERDFVALITEINDAKTSIRDGLKLLETQMNTELRARQKLLKETRRVTETSESGD